MSHSIEYGKLMHEAMRGLIRQVLCDVQKNGLPEAHHFFITFDTSHPDAELADWLADRYPREMTVVMQHWFDNLEVSDEGFSVTLNFGDSPEPLYIPYDAIKTFVDPSVEFGLRFDAQSPEDLQAPAHPVIQPVPSARAKPAAEAPKHEAEVVSLDQFRKD